MTAPRTILIGDGDPSTLAALCLEPRADQILIWRAVRDGANSMRRKKTLDAAGRFFNVPTIMDQPINGPWSFPGGDDPVEDGARLLTAVRLARRERADRIVWPVFVGPDDLDRLTQITELVLLIVTIARLDSEEPGLRIETPLLDLTPMEIVDLANKAGAPALLGWPCNHDGESPCGVCDSCRMWGAERAGSDGVVTVGEADARIATRR